jgi:hypothetical protein
VAREPIFSPNIGARVFLSILFFCITIAVWAKISEWRETPEQGQQRAVVTASAVADQRRAEADRATKAFSRRAFDQSLCRASALCRRFAEARQECATAGDFDNCVKIEVDLSDSYGNVSQCTNDGQLTEAWGDKVPNRLECFLLTMED